MKRLVFAAVIATTMLSGSHAFAQHIGIYGDNLCGSCAVNATVSVPATAYITLVTGGAVPGITEAEFKVTGLPAGWFAVSVPNPASDVVVGDPFDGSGATIGFPSCQVGECIVLYTVTIFATSVEADVPLTVEAKTPFDTGFECPTVTLCDGPSPTKMCIGGAQGFINSATNCTVGVENTSWSGIKHLYQ